jgi:3-methylcrotonyl-CoA carboxylase alpha subunit
MARWLRGAGGDEREISVDLREGVHRVTVAGHTHEIRVLASEGGRLDLEIGGRRVRAHVAREKNRLFVHAGGGAWVFEIATAAARRAQHGAVHHEGDVEATMPGQVRAVLVSEGQAVSRNDAVLVLEAMKMELRLRAPRDGRVKRVACAAGDVVERGQLLVEIEPTEC